MATSSLKETQLRYWTEVQDRIRGRADGLHPARPYPRSWIGYSIGKSDAQLSMAMHTLQQAVRVDIYLKGQKAKSYFDELYIQRSEIETELGMPLDWERLEQKLATRIRRDLQPCNPLDQQDWPRQYGWLVQTAERFHKVFERRVSRLT